MLLDFLVLRSLRYTELSWLLMWLACLAYEKGSEGGRVECAHR